MSARTYALSAALLLALPRVAPAQPLDAEATTPVVWRVVIQTKPHPLLTAAFRDGLRRDLLAALPPALGPLGTVEVVDLAGLPRDRWEPLWQQFDEKGFAALDAPRDLTGAKTHVLRVEVRDGVYHLESRQLDGFAGLPSPGVRRQATRAPELVGRTAGLMLDRDFGAAGTVEVIDGKPGEVRVRVRGGKLGPLDRVVAEGDVFAVARINRAANRPAPPPARTATGKLVVPPPGTVAPPALVPEVVALRYTLLRVAEPPQDGVARCVVLTNLQNPFPAGGAVVGYRCLKLATVAAPVAVRLINDEGKATTTEAATVRATTAGFGTPPDPREFLDFRDGLYRTRGSLTGVACVTVALGATKEARFPVPVLGDAPVTLHFAVDARAEEKAAFERAVLAVSTRAADARVAQKACFDAVARLIQERKNAEARDRAKAGADAAATADVVLSEDVRLLKEKASQEPGALNLLNAVEQQLAALRAANAQLAARLRELDAVVAKENDPAAVAREVQAQSVNTRISLLLANGEIEEALQAYDQLATLLPEQPDIKARRDRLAAEWKAKTPAHETARDYLLKTWPAVATLADLKDSLPQLRGAVEACKAAGDKYAFRRLLGVLGGLPVKVSDLSKDLDPTASAADKQAVQDAMAALEVARKLEVEVAEFLKANP